MWRFQWTREPTPLTDDIRETLYEESQGIIDIIIKLFMLAQLHAIQLGVLRGRAERLDAGLLRHVARESFQLIAPMITALKRDDRRALLDYGDLTPLQDYVRQAFQDAAVRLSPTAEPAPPGERAAAPAANGGEAVLAALESLGVARDLAEVLVARCKSEHPDVSPIDLVAAVSEKLRERGPEAKPAKPKKGRSRAAPSASPADPDDLRSILAGAGSTGTSAYEALLAAGAIKPPLEDAAA